MKHFFLFYITLAGSVPTIRDIESSSNSRVAGIEYSSFLATGYALTSHGIVTFPITLGPDTTCELEAVIPYIRMAGPLRYFC